jgi:hypothetical protein
MSDSPVLVWFRRDLRLADNPALHAACESGRPVIPVFIWAPTEEAPWEPGGAAKWWLHHALESLRVSLEKMGSRLVVRRGPTVEALTRLMSETGATAVYWNRFYEPAITERDARIKSWLRGSGVEASSFNAALMFEPNVVQTRLATPYTVFTPYWRACMEQPPPDAPLPDATKDFVARALPELTSCGRHRAVAADRLGRGHALDVGSVGIRGTFARQTNSLVTPFKSMATSATAPTTRARRACRPICISGKLDLGNCGTWSVLAAAKMR